MTGLVRTSSDATRSWSSSSYLLVGTPSAIRPELAFSRAEHSLSFSDVIKACRLRRKTFLFLFCFLLKVCRQRRKTFLFLLCFLFLKVCQQRRKTFLFLFYFFFLLFFLSYFSLQQIFSNDFSVISQPISMKFGMFIVLDETKSLNIISSQDQGSGQGVVPKFYYAL